MLSQGKRKKKVPFFLLNEWFLGKLQNKYLFLRVCSTRRLKTLWE